MERLLTGTSWISYSSSIWVSHAWNWASNRKATYTGKCNSWQVCLLFLYWSHIVVLCLSYCFVLRMFLFVVLIQTSELFWHGEKWWWKRTFKEIWPGICFTNDLLLPVCANCLRLTYCINKLTPTYCFCFLFCSLT